MKRAIAPLSAMVIAAGSAAAADAPGSTRISRWKDDKACAFVLMFDDSMPTHVKHVVPELAKRGLTGTFYVNQGTGHYAANRKAWEEDIPRAGFELANHTLKHGGGATKDDIAKEVRDANEAIHRATPGEPWPRLVSWGQPGGIKPERWPVSRDELAGILRENNLVPRPDFGGRGAAIALKTGAEMLAHVDRAIASGSMECIIFHGVGGEWISAPLPEFIALADGLVERRDRVWVTGHIPAHRYAAERDAATVKLVSKSSREIRLGLACTLDAALYDEPLTLVTAVPAGWKSCRVEQGKRRAEAKVEGGTVRYDAMPGKEPVMITKR